MIEIFVNADDSAHVTVKRLIDVTVNGMSPVYAVDSRAEEYGYLVGEEAYIAFLDALAEAGYRG